MTPFQKEGYTKETKFKVLVGYGDLRVGDIVTLDEDTGYSCPRFKTDTGVQAEMFLPSYRFGKADDLEVYEESKELTPFEEAGYTKETKFKALISDGLLKVGDIVTLYEDDGTCYPYFKTQNDTICEKCLPNFGYFSGLEVYEEECTKNNTTLNFNCVPTVINLNNVKVFKDIGQYQVSNEAENFVLGGLSKKRAYSLTQEL